MLSAFNRRSADWFVGIDQSGLNQIGPDSDLCSVIPNVVDMEVLSPSAEAVVSLRSRFNCEDDTVLFVSVCRITKSNGSLPMAEMLANLKHKLPNNVQFVFCGFSGSHSEYEKETLAAIAKSKFVHAMDFTNDVASLVAASDVVMAPFVSAHSARIVIEGAALGRPALVTDFPNLREQILVDESGLVFRFNDPDSLVNAIQMFSDLSLIHISEPTRPY